MNKIIGCLAMTILLMASCKKDDSMNPVTIEMAIHPSWESEDFKPRYTNLPYVIQFPENYEGYGMIQFEGPTFTKNRDDDKVSFHYGFCGATFCDPYGEALAEPTPDSIDVTVSFETEVTMASKTMFSLNDEIIGILYYNIDDEAHGRYFMKQGNEFLEALHVKFDFSEYDEVESIIKTILESLI